MNPSDNSRGAGLMVASMAAFAFEDLFLKRASMALPPGQVVAMTGAAGAVVFWIIAAMRGEKILSRDAFCRPALIRTVSEAVAMVLYITALALIPLSVSAALLQASPLVVTMAAAIFLREPVGWRRWTAISVGFLGVLIILRPGTQGFHAAGLLTVACVVILAARDVSTRMMPARIGTFQLTTWAYIALVPASLILLAFDRPPEAVSVEAWADLSLALITGLIGYWAVTAAMRQGEISFIAPFRYVRLVFALIVAAIFLGERPDVWMICGATLVIGSGVYTWWREGRLKRRGRIDVG